MREQAVKLQKIENSISKEKGNFELFALFLREDASNKWDLLISADWARENKRKALTYMSTKIRQALTDKELLMLSRVIILNKDDIALDALRGAVQVEHGLAEISDSNFLGLAIKHAYIITSKKH